MKKTYKTDLRKTKGLLKRAMALCLLIGVSQACSDDFLDQTNPNSLTTQSFWKNNSQLNQGLNSTYSALKNSNVLGIRDEAVRTDIAVPSGYRQATRPDEMYFQDFTANTKYVENKWNALYLGIFRANQVIENYERLAVDYNSDAAREEGLRVYAQARALRGYFYHVLNVSFNNGNVPLVSSVPKDFEEFQKALSSSDAVQAFYREDLQFGVDNLPKTYAEWESLGSNNLGRITAGACEALLGKSYLAENDFQNAEIHFRNVIENYNYALVEDIATNVTGIAEFNSESIFEINYTTNVNLETNGEESLAQNITHMIFNANIQPSSWLVMKYRAEKPDPADSANINVGANVYNENGEIIGTEDRMRLYGKRMGDCMGQVDDPDTPMYGVVCGEYGNATGVSPFARNRANMFKKFLHWNTIGGGAGEDRSTLMNNRSGINIPVIRLADVYLMYSECMIELGNLSEALRYINRVRKRSHLILLGKSTEAGAEFNNLETTYMDDIDFDSSNGEQPVTLDNLMEHLRFTERPLEMGLEDDRSVDLRRWGKFKEQLVHMASISYDYWNFEKNLNGKHGTRYKCFLTVSGEEPTTFTGLKVFNQPAEIQDVTVGAQKFNESIHSYLPMPQSEIDSNLNWDEFVQ
ncbi:RagB/SusD family nutrient uptake outer membrane protein [Zobellia galactanivorans]|uniref:RagB/SusD family nutrient uptake outer membrane protein n=1 Tax=Zobellia galactanivorans (strain DSM 12802 / CCUG 47099 / CIP 106680 / NCIMB 13871 / Dsij) TaxID=63186 RepID=UPI001C065884|nr:RagB/SusD family nutrient uptake outer membrane protein [Zobellia galactanivorans]MBU3024288.1 RagB/SusD family nutrient uptake outer membrane protein [Zobellia galactanivorans]